MRPTGPRLDKHGFPIPPDFDEAGVEDPGRRPALYGPWLRSMLKLAIIAGLLLALWFHFDLSEKVSDVVGQYHAQKAITLARGGDYQAALGEIDTALAWTPNSVAFLYRRAQIRLLMHDYAGALPDVETALSIKPNDEQVQSIRMELLHRLHRHRDAIAAASEMLERRLGGRASTLNTRAYERALDETSTAEELEGALADVDESLAGSPDDASFLDTRGYVLFRLGRHKEALADLDKAITSVERQRDDFERAGRGRKGVDQAFFRAQQQEMFDQNLAVMYHHRGEVRQKLGEAAEGAKDIEIGKRLGFDPAAGVY